MKTLSKLAAKRVNQLIALAEESETNIAYLKINNNPKGSGIMPVTIEHVDSNQCFDFYSIAHYYEQNGDLMADPEIVFARSKREQDFIIPFSSKMDGLATYREFLKFDGEGAIISAWPRQIKEISAFTTQWMANIWSQQEMEKFIKDSKIGIDETV